MVDKYKYTKSKAVCYHGSQLDLITNYPVEVTAQKPNFKKIKFQNGVRYQTVFSGGKSYR